MGVEQYLGSSSYPMAGGDGPSSYARNSSYQKDAAEAAKEMIVETIANNLDLKALKLGSSEAIKIVDIGCSVGPNTFFAVQNIIDTIKTHKINTSENSDSSLEFYVYFNDHCNNDFNTLFKTFPPSQNYFAAGVPGSFYGRLFPKSSLHILHSSYSLNWLSKVPAEVLDRESPAWNKDNIYANGSSKQVVEAYRAQYKSDMESFLVARAQEIVPGGLMIIILPASPNGIPASETTIGSFFDFVGTCLTDMAKTGIISEEKVDTYNVPVHVMSPKEIEEIIQGTQYFKIERMDELDLPVKIATPFKEQFLGLIRAVSDGLIREHFGNELVDEIFNYFELKFSEKPVSFQDFEKQYRLDLFIVLKRVID